MITSLGAEMQSFSASSASGGSMCRGPEGRKVELMRSFAVACKSSCRRNVPGDSGDENNNNNDNKKLYDH